MTANLDNLVRTGQLKREPPAQPELDGLISSGLVRLDDAENASLSLDGRFDLAYNAAHALSLAALRWHGYRSDNRLSRVPDARPYPEAAQRAVACARHRIQKAERRRI